MRTRLMQVVEKFIPKIITWLQKLLDKTKTSSSIPINLETLTPTADADEDDIYKSALKNAIDNTKNLNIGITGAYGSGKSSILESFKKRYGLEYNILSISLASFNENKLNDSNVKNGNNNSNEYQIDFTDNSLDDNSKHEVNQLIELSILQQLLYHVRIKDLPNSRFKRIRRQSVKKIGLYSILLMLWFFSIIFISEPGFLKTTILWSQLNWDKNGNIIADISFVYYALGCIILIFRMIRFAHNSRLSKLNLKDGEIEIDCPNDRSILNRYLDEVFYFFEMTKHNVVIIEDLDRFRNSMIFTKLRELNNLLNNSDQIKKSVGKIVFIYALRDNMFKDKSRTKFFDVIIPVIPIINTTNSGDMFLKLLKDSDPNHSLSTDFISDISLFIDDMRLLKNIYNEYLIYKTKIPRVPDQNKLLAIIVYKNIYPADFVDLHNGKGIVSRILKLEKPTLIKDFIKLIDNQIEELNSQIKEIQNTILANEKEIRAVYINAIWNKLPQGSSQIIINGSNYYYNQLSENEIFSKLLEYGANVRPNNYPGKIVTFKELEKEVNQNSNYHDRLTYCRQKGEKEIDLLRKNVEKLNVEKNAIKSLSIAQISHNQNIAHTFIELNESKNSLILYLLQKGYIDEDYEFYISFFHEGSLTHDDRCFLISIKKMEGLDFDFKLSNFKEIIKKLRTTEFEQKEVLNLYLLDHLITHKDEYNNQLHIIINQLTNETQRSIEFIDLYIDEGKNIPYFIEQLTQRWKGIWNYIELITDYSIEHKNKYLTLIIQYANMEDIIGLHGRTQFSSYVANNSHFLSLIPVDYIKKATLVIEKLGIIFKTIEDRAVNPELFDFIYENNHYKINEYMIALIVKEKGKEIGNLSELLRYQIFTVIRTTNCQRLIAYISKNIVDYVENVLLELKDNTEESEESIIDLLNDPALDNSLKEKILLKNNTKISDLSMIEDRELFPFIAEHFKMLPNWPNVYTYLETENETDDNILLKPLDDSIIKFLNEYENSRKLYVIGIIDIDIDENLLEDLEKKIVLCTQLNYIAFKLLVDCFSHAYDELPCKDLSREKVAYLIDSSLLNPTGENYDYLKEHFKGLHIKLIEKRPDVFIGNLFPFKVDSIDALSILQSESFNNNQRIELIKSLDESFIEDKKELSTLICEILASESYIALSVGFMQNLFKYSTNLNATIKLFNIQLGQRKLTLETITILLTALGLPYLDITKKGPRPKIFNTYENIELANHLEAMDYISSKTPKGNYIKINTKTK